jgi:hypothetical protein
MEPTRRHRFHDWKSSVVRCRLPGHRHARNPRAYGSAALRLIGLHARHSFQVCGFDHDRIRLFGLLDQRYAALATPHDNAAAGPFVKVGITLVVAVPSVGARYIGELAGAIDAQLTAVGEVPVQHGAPRGVVVHGATDALVGGRDRVPGPTVAAIAEARDRGR